MLVVVWKPMRDFTERDRARLAELLRAPLVPLPPPPKTRKTFQFHWRTPDRTPILIAFGVCAVVLCVTAAVRMYRTSGGEQIISLQAQERAGQLQIRWDPASGAVRRALAARLYITDGDDRLYVKLDPKRLHHGGVSYDRRSDKVELRMTLDEPGGRLVEESTSFVGQLPSAQPQYTAEVRPTTQAVPGAASDATSYADRSAPRPNASQPSRHSDSVSATPDALTATTDPVNPGDDDLGATVNPRVRGQHRARRQPAILSGKNLPITCAVGDVFHKTNAPPGWDTFGCSAKNVWNVIRSQASAERSSGPPMPAATTAIAKPAKASSI